MTIEIIGKWFPISDTMYWYFHHKLGHPLISVVTEAVLGLGPSFVEEIRHAAVHDKDELKSMLPRQKFY